LRNAPLDLGEIELDELPRPARARRRRWPVLVAVAAIAAGVLLTRDAPHRKPASTTPPTTGPIPADIRVFAARGLDDTVVVGAPVGYEATGSLASIDLARKVVSQRVHDVRLWPGDFPTPMVPVGDRLVWSDGERAWSVATDLGDEPVVIGRASFVVAAGDGRRVWLVEQDPMRATAVDAVGVGRAATIDLPGWPLAGVDDGLLVDADGRLDLVGSSGRTVRTFWNRSAVAAGGHLALTGSASLLDLDTGVARPTGIGDAVEAASFSPDGRHVAVVTGPPGTRRAGVTVLDAGTGAITALARSEGSSILAATIAWASDGRAVYFLVAAAHASADRVIGVPVDGSAQTVAVLDDAGWYWLAAR
jgi:hypothetical protein